MEAYFNLGILIDTFCVETLSFDLSCPAFWRKGLDIPGLFLELLQIQPHTHTHMQGCDGMEMNMELGCKTTAV
jgi:hypothetical protein